MKISGIVVPHTGTGSRLGYPTANVALDHLTSIDSGVFLCEIIVRDVKYPALAVSGVVTHDPKSGQPVVEVHILDFEDDIVGEHVTVDIQEKLRDIVQFSSSKELVEQIEQDIAKAESILDDRED